ncbi:hypothetical protein B0H34DRAFT_167797 [Crassisporium funariophilum]|nr:hypothetical protein B0H34DRAFT_167797 [Crassisporium funariophilum]
MVNVITFKNLAKMTAASAGTLKTLHLRVIGLETEQPDPFFGLCEELEAMKNCNVVETITVSVGVEMDERPSRSDGWQKLYNVLNQPGWPRLKHVVLNNFLANGLSTRGFDDLLKTQFARLANEKLIDLQPALREREREYQCLGNGGTTGLERAQSSEQRTRTRRGTARVSRHLERLNELMTVNAKL